MKKAMTKARTRTRTRTRTKMTTIRATKSQMYRPEDLIRTNGSMEIDPNLMHMKTARAMAKSLKRSADSSKHLTHSPFHSALSTLNHLITHVEVQKARLEAARSELRQLYGELERKSSGDEPPRTPDEYGWHRKKA